MFGFDGVSNACRCLFIVVLVLGFDGFGNGSFCLYVLINMRFYIGVRILSEPYTPTIGISLLVFKIGISLVSYCWL